MRGSHILLLLVLGSRACCACAHITAHNTSARIAIIGAGVGGSTAAWFLREQLGPAIQLDVYVCMHGMLCMGPWRLQHPVEEVLCPHQQESFRARYKCRYESGDIGGRTQTFEHEGQVYEMGASIIHGQNKYFR